MKKYMVALSYSRDDFENIWLNYREADSVEELQQEVRNFIEENEVMASEWEGGQVYDLENKTSYGIIAYNGKFFNKEQALKLGLK